MLGYAPKKMCRPVSTQSPSLSFHALTLPPSTSARSTTTGLWPASTRYFAQDRPARPPPTTATRLGAPLLAPRLCSLRVSALDSLSDTGSTAGVSRTSESVSDQRTGGVLTQPARCQPQPHRVDAEKRLGAAHACALPTPQVHDFTPVCCITQHTLLPCAPVVSRLQVRLGEVFSDNTGGTTPAAGTHRPLSPCHRLAAQRDTHAAMQREGLHTRSARGPLSGHCQRQQS